MSAPPKPERPERPERPKRRARLVPLDDVKRRIARAPVYPSIANVLGIEKTLRVRPPGERPRKWTEAALRKATLRAMLRDPETRESLAMLLAHDLRKAVYGDTPEEPN